MTVIQPVNVPQPVKLTVEQFEMLDGSGAFDGYAKTELIEGAIYAMNSQYSAHAVAKSELGVRLANALKAIGSPLRMVVEGTVDMRPVSAPEPDITLASVATGLRGYIPLPAVALAVEVADSSISFDLKIPAAMLHQLWQPAGTGYEHGRSVPLGGLVASVTMPDLRIETEGLI
jgi:Uma2 family endonuclease